MTRNSDVLERLAPLSGAPSRGFEDLLRLRARRQRARKIGTIAVVTAIIVALLTGLGTMGDRRERPANPPDDSNPGTFTGMVIRYTGDLNANRVGDLVAEDPSTGEAITVVEGTKVSWAAASADGRWVAFEASCGLQVTNGVDEPRLLMRRCAEGSDAVDTIDWAWSTIGSRLATADGNKLLLIDPATGDRTDLAQTVGDVNSLAWSPDGTQIAYADGNSPRASVYMVSVNGGTHALIAESLGGRVLSGREGAGVEWSPDGTRIAVATGGSNPSLYVMNADGSHRQLLAEGVLIAQLGSPSVAWSPDGTRIAYATFQEGHDRARVWSAASDGSAPVLVFDPTSAPPRHTDVGGPIWSPDGTQIAFRYDSHSDQRSYLIANADGTGNVHEIDELQYRGWRGGWYFCECYG